MNFNHDVAVVEVDNTKEVSEIEVELVASDIEGEANVTDIMLQGGSAVTMWTGHPSEVRWSYE